MLFLKNVYTGCIIIKMKKIKFTYRIDVAPMEVQLRATSLGLQQNLMPILTRIEPENGEILDGKKVDLLPYFQTLPDHAQEAINRLASQIFSQIEKSVKIGDEFSFPAEFE